MSKKKERLTKGYNLPDMTFCTNDKCDKRICKRKLSEYEQRLLLENDVDMSFAYFTPEECDQYGK